MRKSWLFLAAVLVITGCDRPTSDNQPPPADGFCVSQTDTARFDAIDYYGNGRHAMTHDDPLAVYQWHLYNFGQKAGTLTPAVKGGEDLNVTAVWNPSDLNKTGRGVTIAVVDTGVDVKHPDLSKRYVEPLSWNYAANNKNPSPLQGGGNCFHGTACAGIAAAEGFNGIGVMGVAPGAYYAGLNTGLGCGFDATEGQYADALSVYSNRGGRNPDLLMPIDIFSNSWGCSPLSPDCLSAIELDAMREGVALGRSGKGAIYLFAAGNDRARNANANYFAEQNGFETISVAALDSDGTYASYSNPGANILVGAYGGDNPLVMTTDIRGCKSGYNLAAITQHKLNWNGDYTHLMNGTSAATPMIAGVVALMLEANPDLTWRDVRYILATTARKNDPDNNVSWQTNGAGHRVSHDYGFGVADAYSAVKRAQTFQSFGGSESLKTQCHSGGSNNTIAVSEINVTHPEFVTVQTTLLGGSAKTVGLKLVGPEGNTYSTLSTPNNFLADSFYNNRRFGSVRHLDENISGLWKLEMTFGSSALQQWELCFYGRQE